MKYQVLFYQKKNKTMKTYSRLSSAAVLIGALILRVKLDVKSGLKLIDLQCKLNCMF